MSTSLPSAPAPTTSTRGGRSRSCRHQEIRRSRLYRSRSSMISGSARRRGRGMARASWNSVARGSDRRPDRRRGRSASFDEDDLVAGRPAGSRPAISRRTSAATSTVSGARSRRSRGGRAKSGGLGRALGRRGPGSAGDSGSRTRTGSSAGAAAPAPRRPPGRHQVVQLGIGRQRRAGSAGSGRARPGSPPGAEDPAVPLGELADAARAFRGRRLRLRPVRPSRPRCGRAAPSVASVAPGRARRSGRGAGAHRSGTGTSAAAPPRGRRRGCRGCGCRNCGTAAMSQSIAQSSSSCTLGTQCVPYPPRQTMPISEMFG